MGNLVPRTFWSKDDVGSNRTSKNELRALFPGEIAFDTPKPERLIERVLHIATQPGDLVLDSFLGSGTTAAVAHKMRRRYVGIEMGDNAQKYCAPRLERVIAGEEGGVSELVQWKGGGGFKLPKLADRVFDNSGAINPSVRFGTLAAFIWLQETGTPSNTQLKTPFLGVHGGVSYYLLYNGILGDLRPHGGNVLTGGVLQSLIGDKRAVGPSIVYGEGCRLSERRLQERKVTFKHIPYDIKAR